MVDISKFKAELSEAVDQRQLNQKAREHEATQHGERVLQPFIEVLEAAHEVAPDIVQIWHSRLNQSGNWTLSCLVRAEQSLALELEAPAGSGEFKVSGFDQTAKKQILDWESVDDFSATLGDLPPPISISLDRLQQVVDVFAEMIKRAVLSGGQKMVKLWD